MVTADGAMETTSSATVTTTEADTCGSAAQVAVIATRPALSGAVNTPPALMLPPEADQMTEVFVVPLTDAVNCCCLPLSIVRLPGVTVTDISPGEPSTVTRAESDLVGSAMLVAVTVAVPAEAGAVNRPVLSIFPADAVQVTRASEEFVTSAENCCCPPAVIVTSLGDTITESAAGDVAVTVTFADADAFGSATLLAVTVTTCGDGGAVNRPVASTLPAEAVQVTRGSEEFVTVAENC